MKKRWILVLMLVFLSAGLLYACNSKSGIRGEFNQSVYTISLDDEINLSNEFSVNGIEAKNVSFISSNEDVLSLQKDGIFKANASGQAYVFARYQDKNIAETKVNVKYKFSLPKNLAMNDGVFTFDPSFVVTGNSQLFASRYQLDYKLNGVEQQSIILNTPQRTFQEKGIYEISVTALGNDVADVSDKAEGIFTYGVMLPVKNFNYTCSTALSQQTQFTWESDEENVSFDVYLQGMQIEKDLTRGEFSFNFLAYDEGSQLTIKIVSKDTTGERDDTSQEFKVKILNSPDIEYKCEDNSGYITWASDPSATKYRLNIYNKSTTHSETRDIEQGENLKQYLSGLDEGIYSISIMAVGGKNNGENFISSKMSQSFDVAKLAMHVPTVLIDGNVAKVTFSESGYLTHFKITCAGKTITHDVTASGVTANFELPTLTAGKYNLHFTALPVINGETQQVEDFYYNGNHVNHVIDSDEVSYEIYKLGNFSNIVHSFEGTTSKLTFDAITNANYYQVYVNDIFVESTTTKAQDKVTLSIGNLKEHEPLHDVHDEYKIKVVAGRREEGVDIAILSEKEKTLTILDVATKSLSQTNGYFSWNEINQPCRYKYTIYKTDSTYNKETGSQVAQDTINDTTIVVPGMPLPTEGYYVIEILSLPLDTFNGDMYFSSNFHDEDRIAKFQFIVERQIDTPEVTFSEDDTPHLDVTIKEHTGKFIVYVDDNKDGEVSLEQIKEEKYTYNFKDGFSEAKKYQIKVECLAGDKLGAEYDSTIYKDCESKLFVTRIDKPTIEVKDQTKDNYGEYNKQELFIYDESSLSKNAVVLLNGNQPLERGYSRALFNQTTLIAGPGFDLSGEGTSTIYRGFDLFDQTTFGAYFELQITLQAKENEGNEYYLSSIPATYKFRRIETPTELKYTDGNLTWTSVDDKTADFYLAIVLKNSELSDCSQRFFLQSLECRFEMQRFIDEELSKGGPFATAYAQSETKEFNVELIAYKNGYVGDEYILFSSKARTNQGGNTLVIKTLATPTLEFDVESEQVSWESVANGCKYDIYVDGKIKQQDYNLSLSISKDELASDYLTEKKITIMAKHSEQLNSKLSEPIYIKKLTPPSEVSLGVTSDGVSDDVYTITVPVTDPQNTLHVKLQGVEMTFSKEVTHASAILKEQSGASTIIFEADNNDKKPYYYLDSDPVTITLKNVATEEFKASIEGGVISWTSELCDYLTANSSKYSQWPLKYNLEIKNNGNTYPFSFDNETSIKLVDLEEQLSQKNAKLTNDDVEIDVKESIINGYTCAINTEYETVIYYGSNEADQIASRKLKDVQGVKHTFVDNTVETGAINRKLKGSLKITFTDLWSEHSEVYFVFKFGENLTIPGYEDGLKLQSLVKPNIDKTTIYTFSKDESNNYVLELTSEVQFEEGDTVISIQVFQENSISSNITEFTISRYKKGSMQVNEDNGLLTIEDDNNNAGYIIEFTIGTQPPKVQALESGVKEFDLMQDGFLLENDGEYTIRVIACDLEPGESNVLPSAEFNINGIKLAGIETITIDESDDEIGVICIKIFTDENNEDRIKFRVIKDENSSNVKEFTPIEDSETQGLYKISLLDILYLFDSTLTSYHDNDNIRLDFTIAVEGSVRADYKQLEFGYKIDTAATSRRIRTFDKDYIVFEKSSDDITKGFVVDVTYTVYNMVPNEDGNGTHFEEEEATTRIFVKKEDAAGYWSTRATEEGDKGAFSKERSETDGNSYKECYGLCLDDLLAMVNGGNIHIKVSRVGLKASNYYQFNPTDFDFYKLNSTTSEGNYINNNELNIQWENIYNADETKRPGQYLIYFIKGEEKIEVNRYYSSISTINLSGSEFTFISPGTVYTIQIKAISADEKVLSSDLSQGINFKKFNKPYSLQVENGKIVFNKDKFKDSQFMQDIITGFGESAPAGGYKSIVMGQERLSSYTAPFEFEVGRFSEMRLVLKFTQMSSDGVRPNKTYQMTVPAYKLIPDMQIEYYHAGGHENTSYLKALNDYEIEIRADNDATNLRVMINKLIQESAMGIADDGILFDDYGNSIPAGEYQLTAYQGSDSSNIQSDVCDSSIPVYISPAPIYDLTEEEDRENGKNYYYAEFTAQNTKFYNGETYVDQMATVYKMSIRKFVGGTPSKNDRVELKIEYDEHEKIWRIRKDDTEINNVITTLDGGKKFKVNMTQLRKELDDKDLTFNEKLQVDVYACANDNGPAALSSEARMGYVINGKSAVFNLTYLDLDASNIVFDSGTISVSGDIGREFKLLVKYKHERGEQSSKQLEFDKEGKALIDFDTTGNYEYISIALSGSYDKMNGSLVVESFTYMIAGKESELGGREGVYKLQAPTLSTSNGNIVIGYNQRDAEVTGTLKFFMGNNNTLVAGGDGYYYESDIYPKDVVPQYMTGYCSLEESATEYHAFLGGNGGTFQMEKNEDLSNGAEYILKLFNAEGEEINPILKSAETVLQARMLSQADPYVIEKGSVSIPTNVDNLPEVYDGEFAGKQKVELIYEIVISYYESNSDAGLKHDTFFYSEIEPDVTVFDGLNFDTNYEYYTLKVTVVAAKRVESGSSVANAKKSIQGNYFIIHEKVFYEDGAQVLRSKVNDEERFTKTRTPYLEKRLTGDGVDNGEISFIIDNTIYFANSRPNPEKDYTDEDTAERLTVYADYQTPSGDQRRVEVSGKYSFARDNVEGDKIKVVYVPDEGQLNDCSGAITLSVYAYGKGTIISQPLVIEDVYKLKNMTKDLYEVKLENDKTIIDFTEYFDSVDITGDKSCYKIVINVTTNGEEVSPTEIDNMSISKKFTVASNYTKLQIQVIDAQEVTQVNAKKLLLSDLTTMDVQATSTEGLTLTWNEELQRFEWNWEEDDGLAKEYYISMTIGNKPENGFIIDYNIDKDINNKFYMPKQIGTIYARTISIKVRYLNEQEDKLYIYSEGVAYSSTKDVKYNLFSKGDGTSSETAYEIYSADDFKNMRLRNENGIYFALKGNFDIPISYLFEDGKRIFESFKASLSGEGHEVKIISDTIIEKDEEKNGFVLDGYSQSDLKFNNYSSLFKTIESGATISNLNINYEISDGKDSAYQLKNNQIMFAPLAYENNGKISNVSLINLTIKLKGDGANRVFIGGIVAVNRASITECYNKYSLNFTAPQGLTLNFAFAGIALFNISGVAKIDTCFNESNISVMASVNDSFINLAGIVLGNSDNATISYCGNEGDITFGADSNCPIHCYGGGIVVTNANGKLDYLYNNGQIGRSEQSPGEGSNGDMFGGIAASIDQGYIHALVDTVSGQKLVGVVKGQKNQVNNEGDNYASQDSRTEGVDNIRDLAPTTIAGKNGKSLEIYHNGDSYKARFITQ